MEDRLSNADAARVADILWQYRRQLERMEFLLETQLLLAKAGKDEYLHHIADLLNETADSLAYIDLQREVLLSDYGVALDLTNLVASAEAPWDEVIRDHQQWFAAIISRIQELSSRNKRTIEQSQITLNRLADALNGSPESSYDGSGNKVTAQSSAMLFDGRA